ncbi:MAG: FtsX-like permease family protein [Candidatus Flexifilum sp.]
MSSLQAILRMGVRFINRRLLQSVLFIIGVALGVAMMIAIDLANTSSKRAFELSTQSVTGRATHQIIGGPGGLPTELYRRLRVDLHLGRVAPVIEDYVRGLNVGDQPLRVFGVDPFAEPPFRDYLTEVEVAGETQNAFQALNAFIARPNTAVISAGLADRYGLTVGDTLSLRPAAGQVDLTIVGLLEVDDAASAQAIENLVLVDIATAQAIIGSPGSISRIDLILPDDYDIRAIEALLPPGARITTPSARSGALAQMTAAFELNLQALSLLALVVGVFLIYNTVTFSVVQRRPLLGTLRALGTTRRQLFLLIVGEALLLGALGTALGLGLGIILGRATVGLIAQTISDLYFTVSVQGVALDIVTLIKGAAVGLGASIGAALLPALDATRTPPAGSLRRSQLEEQTTRLLPFITGAALALIALGIGLLALPTDNLIVSFAALFAIVIGGALLTPGMLVIGMRLFTPLTGSVLGVVGRMAPRSVARSLSRTSVAVAALTVAVSVIVGVSAMIGSFRGTVADWLETTLGADIYISPPSLTATRALADVDRALVDRARAVAGVDRVVIGRNVDVIAPDYADLPPVNLTIADGEVVSRPRRFVWTTTGADYWDELTAGAIMVSEPFAFRRGITPERNRLTLLTDRGPHTFTVVGVYYDYSTDQGTVFMADPVYRQWFDDPYISTMAVFLTPGADGGAVLEAVRAALAGTELVVQSNRALRSGVFEIFERTFAITGALRLLATIVAFIGILSALLALQLEQARQFGVMRAVGMTGPQLWTYTLTQTGLMGLTAGVLSLPIGAALAYVLIYVINVRSFGWTMQLTFSADEFLLAIGVAVLAALAAGLYPAHHLSRLVTARALRSE